MALIEPFREGLIKPFGLIEISVAIASFDQCIQKTLLVALDWTVVGLKSFERDAEGFKPSVAGGDDGVAFSKNLFHRREIGVGIRRVSAKDDLKK